MRTFRHGMLWEYISCLAYNKESFNKRQNDKHHPKFLQYLSSPMESHYLIYLCWNTHQDTIQGKP